MRLLLIAVSIFSTVLTTATTALSVTYTIQGEISGSLDSNSFSNAELTLLFDSVPPTFNPGGGIFVIGISPPAFDIAGVGIASVSLALPFRTDDNTDLGSLLLIPDVNYFEFTIPDVLGIVAITIPVGTSGVGFSPMQSDLGMLDITAISNGTFAISEAVAEVPLPGGLLLLLSSITGVWFAGRFRSSKPLASGQGSVLLGSLLESGSHASRGATITARVEHSRASSARALMVERLSLRQRSQAAN